MSEKEPSKDPLRAFTTAGRLLVIVTLLASIGFFYWNVMFIYDHFPAGHYPLAFLLIPVLLAGAAFFGVATLILKCFGIRVWKQPDDQDGAG
jgi:hypothetical protein